MPATTTPTTAVPATTTPPTTAVPATTTPTTATPAFKTPPPTTTTTPPAPGRAEHHRRGAGAAGAGRRSRAGRQAWNLACQTKSEVELDLAYVDDALNQGNILGARALLEAWITESASYGNEGLMSAAEVSTFDTDATEILNAIPTEGHFDNEFHPSTYVPPPVPVACSKLPVAPPDSTISTTAAATSLPIEDLNNASRIIFKTALGKVPGVGFVLGALIELLWPTSAGNNVTWQQMSEYVDQKIGQAVDQITKDDLDNKLTGLSGVLHNYEIALQDPSNPTFIRENFVSALNHLTARRSELLPADAALPGAAGVRPDLQLPPQPAARRDHLRDVMGDPAGLHQRLQGPAGKQDRLRRQLRRRPEPGVPRQHDQAAQLDRQGQGPLQRQPLQLQRQPRPGPGPGGV